MSSIPVAAWIGLAGIIIGSGITTFGVWLTNRSNLNRLHVQLEHEKQTHTERIIRERLEELFIITDKWINSLAINHLNLVMVMQEKLDYNQYHDLAIDNGEKSKYDFSRIEMIVEIYTHELKEKHKAVLSCRTKVNEIEARYKRAYREGHTNGENYIQSFVKAQIELEKAGEDLKSEIAIQAKNA